MNEQIFKIAGFLRRVDASCARMNSGLSAVAAVLAVSVIFMATIRGCETMAEWNPTFGWISNPLASAGMLPFGADTYN